MSRKLDNRQPPHQRRLKGDTAVRQACHEFGLSQYHARREAKTIEELKDLPQTLEAVNGGLITTEHVRVISDSHRRERFGPAQEQELIWAAMSEDFDDLRSPATNGIGANTKPRKRRNGNVAAARPPCSTATTTW